MSRPLITARWTVCVLVVLLLINHLAHAATVTSVWNVVSGDWIEPSNWTHFPANVGADYPNDDDITYDVKCTNGYVTLLQPASIQSLEFTSSILSNSATLDVASSLHWTSGKLLGPGTLTVTNLLWADGVTNDSTLQLANGYNTFTALDHRGTLIVDGGNATVENSVIAGGLLLRANAVVSFSGTNYFVNGSSIRGTGRVDISYMEGTLTNACRMAINAPNPIFDGPGRLVLAEDASFTVQYGWLRGSGSVEIGPQARMLFEGISTWKDRLLTNYGTCVFSNATIGRGGSNNLAVLHNYGRVDFFSSIFTRHNTLRPAVVINEGLLCFTNDWETGLYANVTNYGSVEMFANYLSVSNLVNFGTGSMLGGLSGNRIENRAGIMALWFVSGTLTNNATCDVTAAGLSVSGAFHQSSNGVLRVDVDESATNQPTIRISGDASFDGTLVVRLTNGFQPSLGQRLHLITNNSAHGFFRRIQGLDLGNGLRLAPAVTPSTFDLVVVETANANAARLTIARAAGGVTLNAPLSLNGFFLQSATNLAHPDWQTFDLLRSNITVPINTAIPQFFIRARDPACCD